MSSSFIPNAIPPAIIPARTSKSTGRKPHSARRNSTSKSPSRHSDPTTPPLPQSLPSTPLSGCRANMMMYNPYQWGGMHGMGGMAGIHGMQGIHGGFNPYMMMGQQQGMMGGMPAQDGGGMKPFDSAKMKQGRLGHYGYLEGRELAGPPVGYMPAGVASPPQSVAGQPAPSARAASVAQGAGAGAPSTAYYGGSGSNSMAWGDPGNAPRARYDGASAAAARYIQADLDTPYPQTAAGGASSAWTRYGADGEILNGVDGRMGMGHKRMREGRV